MSAIVGVLVAQLFVLELEDTGFGYLAVGRPLATLCLVFSICTVLLGTYRAWRHQDAMIRGKALSGGFEIVSVAAIALVVMLPQPWACSTADRLPDDLHLLRSLDCPRRDQAGRRSWLSDAGGRYMPSRSPSRHNFHAALLAFEKHPIQSTSMDPDRASPICCRHIGGSSLLSLHHRRQGMQIHIQHSRGLARFPAKWVGSIGRPAPNILPPIRAFVLDTIIR